MEKILEGFFAGAILFGGLTVMTVDSTDSSGLQDTHFNESPRYAVVPTKLSEEYKSDLNVKEYNLK